MAYLKGITFPNQSMSPKDWGREFEALISDGILKGCEVTYSGSRVYIAPGYFVLKGRLIKIDSQISFNVSGSGYGQIRLGIDNSATSTTSTNNQASATLVTSTTGSFASLTQDDVNGDGTKYEVELGVASYTSGTVTGFTQSLGACGFKNGRNISVGHELPATGNVGDIFIKY